MRAIFNEQGGIDLFPDNSAEVRALLCWEALFAVKTIHEGMERAMQMRPAAALTVHDKGAVA